MFKFSPDFANIILSKQPNQILAEVGADLSALLHLLLGQVALDSSASGDMNE